MKIERKDRGFVLPKHASPAEIYEDDSGDVFLCGVVERRRIFVSVADGACYWEDELDRVRKLNVKIVEL